MTQSLWDADAPRPVFRRLEADVQVDVAIVGGGLTGVTAAMILKQAGLRVALLEGRRVGSGVTGATTAHLTVALDTRYHTLIRDQGQDGARLAAQANVEAIERIAGFVRDEKMDCQFRRANGYLYSENESDLGSLHTEYEAARGLGLNVTMTRQVPLPFPCAAAVCFAEQAQFHPLRYLTHLAQKVEGGGSHVFEHSPVRSWNDGAPCELVTDRGLVRADKVILATDAPENHLLLQTKVAHYRSYAIAFRSDAEMEGALFFDTADPYHYTRIEEIHGRRYVIVGGEDHKVGADEHTASRFDRLEEYARERFACSAVDYRWSAQVVEPIDGLPFVGRNSGDANVFVAVGYSGNGMTWGTASATILADLIQGNTNPYATLLEATRIPLVAGAADFLRENIDFPAHLIGDRLRGAEVDSPEEIGRGEGKIASFGGRRLAVYRDDLGALHALSPVCTHLGCYVHFNDAEKSWDCPCHGSRFDTEGRVLHGPALADLEPVDLDEGADLTAALVVD